MRFLRFHFALLSSAALSGFAAVPTFTVVDTGLNATFGNADKGLFDPQVAGFTGVAYGAGRFVAVGASSNENVIRWATSPDGLTWTGHSQPITAGTTFQTSKVHFLNGKFVFFVGLGDSGTGSTWVCTSADGLTWEQNKVTNGRINVEEFAASSTLTVAAAHNGAQFASADLVTWTSRPVVPNGAGYDHLDVDFGAGNFFSTVNAGGATYESADAANWTTVAQLNAIGGGRVEAGNGVVIFNMGGTYYRTVDGATFTTYTPAVPSGWLAPGGPARFTGGAFAATAIDLGTGKGGYLRSVNGLDWTPLGYYPEAPAVPVGQSRGYFHADLAYGNGRYVIAGTDTSQTLLTKTTLPLVLVLEAAPAPTPPTITTSPIAVKATAGGTATFSVAATGGTLTYQWKHDGVNVAGATQATLTVAHVAAADAGQYTVVVSNENGSTTSLPATLTLVDASKAGHLVNVSIRSNAGSGDQTLIVGAVLGGASTVGSAPMLFRGVGPTLATMNVDGALPDPKLTVFQNTTAIVENDDWAGGFDFAQVGAFALSGAAPKDAAYYAPNLAQGLYTMHVNGKNAQAGIALAEIYSATADSDYTATTPRLINLSARTAVGTGDNIAITGFVVGGSTPMTVLIRAIGPSLTAFGVGGVLTDPKLELHDRTGAIVAANDDWGGTAALKSTFQSVGAFGLQSDGSHDAALTVTLAPGSYTAHVSGVGNTTGVGLIELYEVPQSGN